MTDYIYYLLYYCISNTTGCPVAKKNPTGSEKKSQLEALLQTYNLRNTVDFLTRSQKNSITAIHNILLTSLKNSYCICPIITGLLDHDAQLITFNTITLKLPTKQNMEIGKINK